MANKIYKVEYDCEHFSGECQIDFADIDEAKDACRTILESWREVAMEETGDTTPSYEEFDGCVWVDAFYTETGEQDEYWWPDDAFLVSCGWRID